MISTRFACLLSMKSTHKFQSESSGFTDSQMDRMNGSATVGVPEDNATSGLFPVVCAPTQWTSNSVDLQSVVLAAAAHGAAALPAGDGNLLLPSATSSFPRFPVISWVQLEDGCTDGRSGVKVAAEESLPPSWIALVPLFSLSERGAASSRDTMPSDAAAVSAASRSGGTEQSSSLTASCSLSESSMLRMSPKEFVSRAVNRLRANFQRLHGDACRHKTLDDSGVSPLPTEDSEPITCSPESSATTAAWRSEKDSSYESGCISVHHKGERDMDTSEAPLRMPFKNELDRK